MNNRQFKRQSINMTHIKDILLLRHSAERQNALRHLGIKNDSVSCSILVLQINNGTSNDVRY
jgi:hypothetical protein